MNGQIETTKNPKIFYEESEDEEIDDDDLLDIDMNDFDKFRESADEITDINVLMTLMDRSIRKQMTREKNMQYISKRIKQIVIKSMGKDMKKMEEKSKKKIVRGGINNVFSINNALCTLLKYPEGSKKSWTQVTADIWKYISDNNLKDPDNKKMIIPDEALKKCLGIKKSSIIMLDLPSYLSNMFKNKEDNLKE